MTCAYDVYELTSVGEKTIKWIFCEISPLLLAKGNRMVSGAFSPGRI